MTKVVKGIHLPDDDTHFAEHLEKGPEFQGAGTYQLLKIQKALGLVDRKRFALDVGAHVGLWSRVLSAYFREVLAIEPLPAHIECFNLNLADRQNVTLKEAAVSDKAGTLKIASAGGNSGNAHISGRGKAVEAIRIDDLGLNHLDFMKIDVEGYELSVIRGAEKTIKHFRPVMVVEQKPGNAERYKVGQTDAVQLLLSWGFQVALQKSGDYFLKWGR